jgi:cystathionine gamma-synthase
VPADHGFETLAIHAGQDPDPTTGAVVPPIYQVSTYKQDGVGGLRSGYEYSRSGNPTRTALEECLAAVEGGRRGLAFASGLAAEDTLLRTVCSPGDHVVIPDDAYGGTYRLFARVLERWGLEHTTAAVTDVDAVRAAIRPGRTRVVWVETPTNPLLGIADLTALAHLAHEAQALLVVDSTFASPYLQLPLAHGADVVVHSTTKYLGGHSDVVGGGLVVADEQLGEELAYHQNAMGAVAGPFDSWLVLRGIRTLAVRMERHCDNAEQVAQLLLEHPRVTVVHYPGLAVHPGHDVAAKQMRRFGGIVSFQVSGGEDAAVAVCDRTRVFTLGESLGGVESLIEHPHRMTHASVAGSPLEVPADLVRLSVGLETAEDLLADLRQALET